MQDYFKVEKHLDLLSQHYPTIESARGKIVYLETLLSLPKGTEFFFSDLHGEAEALLIFYAVLPAVPEIKLKHCLKDH